MGGHGLQPFPSSPSGVFLLDATFMSDVSKFMAGSLLSLSAMVQLEVPHVNVLSKCDLADSQEVILPNPKSGAQVPTIF